MKVRCQRKNYVRNYQPKNYARNYIFVSTGVDIDKSDAAKDVAKKVSEEYKPLIDWLKEDGLKDQVTITYVIIITLCS